MSRPFRVGDKVKCITNEGLGHPLDIGHTYTIAPSTYEDGTFNIVGPYVYLKEMGKGKSYYLKRFVHAEPTPIKRNLPEWW